LGAADFAGQAFENRKSQDDQEVAKGLDVARVARFAFFGFILQVRTRIKKKIVITVLLGRLYAVCCMLYAVC
jgi:hypothetical protein